MTKRRSGPLYGVPVAVVLMLVMLNIGVGAAQGASSQSSTVALAKAYETVPTKIKSADLGAFKPKPGGYIYYVTCDMAIVGCSLIENQVKLATAAIGYKFSLCDGGTTGQQAAACFTNAINAKPSVIISAGIAEPDSGGGYAAAKKAGIPIIGLYAENPIGTDAAEVADNTCSLQASMIATGIVAANPHAQTLFVGDTAIKCDHERELTFVAEYKKLCPSCVLHELQFDPASVTTVLPNEIQAALVHYSHLTAVVGAEDQEADIASTQILEAGKSGSVITAGFDGDPADVQLIRKHQVQEFDATSPDGESGWAAVDAAARIYSGVKVPQSVPVNSFLVYSGNVNAIPKGTNEWAGPVNYEDQFKALWK